MRQLTKNLIALAVGTVLAQASSLASAVTHYRVAILGSPAAGRSIDDYGNVAGYVKQANGALHATLWRFGRQIDLGTLANDPTLSSMVLWPVKNYIGLVSGISLTDQPDPDQEGWSCGFFLNNPNHNACVGFVWDPFTRRMHALPTLGGANGFATGTNDFGQTVGWAENTVKDPTCIAPQVLQFKPVVWGPRHDQVRALPLLPGDGSGAATAINDRGQIVGISGDCGIAVGSVTAKHAVIWDGGTVTQIVTPFGDQAPYWNTPMMLNQRGDVVGFYGVPNDPGANFSLAFLWNREDGFQKLPLLAGDISSTASSINNRRQVVGYSNDASGTNHPWIWQNGIVRNLNDLIEPGSGLTGPIEIAFDINDEGVITGRSTTKQAIVAVPVDD
jgi:probable HAF family extracellular repeat protein